MTVSQFDKLTVDSSVRITVRGKNVPTAWGAAYRINRTTKTIKPLGSNRWYSYKQISIDSKKYPMRTMWAICGPLYVIEMQATRYELEKL